MTKQDSRQKAAEFFQRYATYHDAFKADPAGSLAHYAALDPGFLTYVAEDLPEIAGNSVAAVELGKLLAHARPVVREGALRGIQKLADHPDFRDAAIGLLMSAARCDSLQMLREMAVEMLKDLASQAIEEVKVALKPFIAPPGTPPEQTVKLVDVLWPPKPAKSISEA